MKVLLLFPPAWATSMPHLATPMLTAYLRAQGVAAEQRDLNLEVVDRLLTREHLLGALERLRRLHGARASRRHPRPGQPSPEVLAWAFENGPMLADTVEAAKATFRGPAFWDLPRSRDALQTLAGGLQLAALPFYPTTLGLSAYSAPVREDVSAAVLRLVADPHLNVFYDVLDRQLIPGLLAEAPDLVGISIPTAAQLVAGLTIAHLLRKHGYRGHITAGGPHLTMLRERLPRVPALFDLLDSVVIFDGERPLHALVEALSGDGDLSRVPNLVYRARGQVTATPPAPPVPLDELPTPTFDGLPLGRYLIPEPVLPLIASRGCYHGRCAFCSVGYGGDLRYRLMAPERAVEHMRALRARYGARHIWFADEAIPPRNLRAMAQALQSGAAEVDDDSAPLHWAAYGRLERGITAGLLRELSDAGCRMLFYGLETASPRIAQAMCKGTSLEEASRVLREGAAAGLWNHVFFFFGFPGETLSDAQATVDFLYAHQDAIHSAALGTFMLERHSDAHAHPERYGITRVFDPPERDLAIVFDYEVAGGLDAPMAERVADGLLDALPRKAWPQLYVHDTYRLLYASRLREQGQPYPTWLGGEEAGAP